jgi:glycosyltransferase involved in cell wall biosynthesis
VWHEQRVSVILPTYNEKDSIRQFILDVQATGVVDEIVVVNNNAAPGTSEEIAGTGAREVHESRQGYGFAIRRGLAEATGDYLIVCEPDRTFFARDVFKLLSYGEDFDVVYGSRTSLQLIWRGANMGIFLRWGNWAVAKYMELLYNATTLTDVGCTLRLIRRSVATALLPSFKIGGSEFGPEMMVESLCQRYRVVQVPVNYLPRVGVSAVTGDFWKAFFLGLRMIRMITVARLKRPRLVIPRAPKRELETK